MTLAHSLPLRVCLALLARWGLQAPLSPLLETSFELLVVVALVPPLLELGLPLRTLEIGGEFPQVAWAPQALLELAPRLHRRLRRRQRPPAAFLYQAAQVLYFHQALNRKPPKTSPTTPGRSASTGSQPHRTQAS